jgi:transcriptional regulator with XRE-family HTH domain
MAHTPDRSARTDRSDRADRSDGGKTGSEELARILRARREELGMSRQDLADATGIPYPTVAQIETAYRGVSPARLGLIARVLGLDPKELYDVLASEGAADSPSRAPAPVARASRPDRNPSELGRPSAGGTWHANPKFAAALPMAASPPAPRLARSTAEGAAAESMGEGRAARPAGALGSARSARRTDDHPASPAVINEVVHLLSTLPAEQRIEALGQVQNRLLAQLLEERHAAEE